MMKVVLVLIVALLCVSAAHGAKRNLRSQRTSSPTKVLNVADAGKIGQAKGEAAGSVAGAKAGKAAGSKAGKLAGVTTYNQMTAKKVTPNLPLGKAVGIDKVVVQTMPKNWVQYQSSNPGAVHFFQSFDQNRDYKWNEAEWTNAVKSAMDRKYLPVAFSVTGEWAKLQKDTNGQIDLVTFLTWASKQAAKSPFQPHAATTKPITPSVVPKHCTAAFQFFDANNNGVLDVKEFSKAVAGKVAANHVLDRWYTLPRVGAGETLTLSVWNEFCSALTGLPKGPDAKRNAANPCHPNPCKSVKGAYCVPAPQQCKKSPCPQFKCLKTDVTPATPTNVYGRCTKYFTEADSDKSKSLSHKEFAQGVHLQQSGKTNGANMPAGINVESAWKQFTKTSNQEITLNSYVHWCAAVVTSGGSNGGTSKEECWDVFTHFDGSGDGKLTKEEYEAGMRNARRMGHLPVTLKIDEIWKVFPKDGGKYLTVGPFIDWCLAVSKGANPLESARATNAPIKIKITPDVKSTGSSSSSSSSSSKKTTASKVTAAPSNSSASSNSSIQAAAQQAAKQAIQQALNKKVTHNASVSSAGACSNLFKTADLDSDGYLVMDEFHSICESFATRTMCKNYPLLFTTFDVNKDGRLNAHEFQAVCMQKGKVIHVKATTTVMRAAAAEAGSIAGKAVGSKVGAAAGEAAGRIAGAKAVRFREVESNMNAQFKTGFDAIQNLLDEQ